MITIVARFDAQGRLGRTRRRRLRAVEKAVADTVACAADDVRAAAQARLSVPALDGRPSAPGEAPHRLSGRLRNSVRMVMHSRTGDPAAEIGTDLAYGLYLELGTRRIAPRPWLSPAFATVAPGVARRMADAVRRALSPGRRT
ncbi:MAG: hypothetical protein D6826_02515 [Alphaproteobacteria bacterium]|nr:MAG: hypothetical protein D6826_02515 [Alphaproteobacteria bacterium]